MKYEFSAKMWKDASSGGWFFVSLPQVMSKEIRKNFGWQEEGWGRMKTLAQIREFKWDTAIWFDSKTGVYLLPIKAEIRKKSKLEINEKIEINIWI
ncbi:DUF1905 domain-containing protein [Flavivirga sp. Y03]|uniref:DUF1905 domain-containing protein n=1 Tax=Flavivirga algicola TaxID=2729136 RepID=A0ABX1RT63_9FLAO|nr:DUF1905 domain-containing protein [Flavivirga algicola]